MRQNVFNVITNGIPIFKNVVSLTALFYALIDLSVPGLSCGMVGSTLLHSGYFFVVHGLSGCGAQTQ